MVAEFFFKNWAEFFFFVVMVVGVVLSLAAPSAVVSYIIIFIAGMMAGRILYWRHHKAHFAYILVVVGFLIGYVIGSYYGDRKIVIILFILGAFFSNYLYKKNILRDTLF